MLSKNKIKQINGLQIKKNRQSSRFFVAEGTKIVPELVRSKIQVLELFGTDRFFEMSFGNEIPVSIEKNSISEAELKKISSLTTPNEVLAICAIPENKLNVSELKNKLTLVLDDIRDPGNLGTIIRIADWFGIENIICSLETVDIYNPKVVQATMGSIARVNVFYEDLKTIFLEALTKNNFPIYGTVLNGENIFEKSLTSNGFIVIGNESNGISIELLPLINEKISIPTFSVNETNSVESLNAAIATAIVCTEFKRRK